MKDPFHMRVLGKWFKTMSLPFRVLILSLLCFSMHLSAQDLLNQTDQHGRKQGSWKKIENGVLKYQGQFKDDKPYGMFTYYYDNAQVKAISRFEQSGMISRTTLYHPGGGKMAEGKYVNSLKDSIWCFFNEHAILVAKESYKLGKKEGEWITFYESGQPSEVMPWKEDKRHGTSMQYYADGVVKAKINYAKDKLHGLSLFYHPNGTVMVSGMYEESLKHGKWLSFDENGLTIRTEDYTQGFLLKTEVYQADKKVKTIREDEEANRYMPGQKPPGTIPADSLNDGSMD